MRIPILGNEMRKQLSKSVLKGHGNEADFLGFLHKPVRHRSITLRFEPFEFGFEFVEIFEIEKRLPDSPSWGVDKNAYRYNFFQTLVIVHYIPGFFFAKLIF
jgi:hypothetical protein